MTAALALHAAATAAFVVTLGLVYAMLRANWRWAVDHPNERSLHTHPVPRTGGVAIAAGAAAGVALAAAQGLPAPLVALALAAALAGISLADDRAGLPIRVRLLVHLLVAGLFAAWLTREAAPWWWMLAAVLAITAFTNFFNFMDGANGLAGGMAAWGFGAYGVAALGAAPSLAAAAFALAAAALAFLVFNLRGRIFMGDAGSVPLGFLAAVWGLEGWWRGLWPWWFGPVVFAPFVVDATVTLVRRAARGERFWQAHREHYYQRLVRTGISHTRLARWEYALMAACAGGALAARAAGPGARMAILATIAGLLVLAMGLVDRRWRAHAALTGEPP